MILKGLFLILLAFQWGCSSASDSNNPPPPIIDPDFSLDYGYTRVSPGGGFISAIKYHPTTSGEVWASGDDSSGIYKSTDGGQSWSLMTSVPADHSTYSIVFDPSDPNIVYAPNHFGRGVLKTTNGGTSWSLYSSGLPSTQDINQRLYDLVVLPSNNQIVLVAAGGGLYRSTNGGQSFAQVSSATFTGNSDTSFTSLVVASNSDIFLGSTLGRVYKSTDGGANWTELTAAGWTSPISDMAITANSLYMAFADGMITESENFSSPTGFINDTTGTPDIVSGFYVKIVAVEGANASTDKLYVGSGYVSGDNKWGFHSSDDGGATLTKRVTGLDDSTVFSMDVNPFDSDEIIVGTVNNGVFKTTNQGVSWSAINSGIYANAILGFTENPSDSDNLIFASTAGLTGTSKVWETTNGGTSWSEITFFDELNVRSLYSLSATTLLAGTWYNGIYKTTSGASGTWNQVSAHGAYVNRIRADKVNSNIIYASSYQPSAHADLGVWVSTNYGDSWTKQFPAGTVDVVPHPSSEAEAVALTGGAYATTDSFSSYNEIGLASAAPGQVFMSGAFVPGTSASFIAGSLSGRLYKTENYVASGTGVTWTEISLPTSAVSINSIIAVTANTWYLAAFIADHAVESSSTPGMLKTTDGGQSWEFINSGLYPSRLVYILKSSQIDKTINVGLWGSGLYRLLDTSL